MAIAPLLIAIRTAGAAALARTSAQMRAVSTSVRNSSIAMRQHTRAVSSVAGAYQDANGLWRNANGTLLTQRHTVTYVTTAYGRLVRMLRTVRTAALRAAAAIGGVLRRALRAAADAAGTLLRALARWVAIGTPILGVIIPLIPVLGNLLGAIQLVAPAIVAAVAGFATWKLAMRGFTDAVRAGSPEELAEALKKLSFSAQKAALTLRDLGREWKTTQQKVQEAFFKGARQDFILMSRSLQKVADVWLPKLGKAFADARQWISQVIAASVDSGQLDRIMAGVHTFIRGLLTTIPYLLQAFLDIAEVAAPSFAAVGDGIADAARGFAEWIRAMKENGKLAEWLEKAKTAIGQLKDVAMEVGGVIKAIFDTAGGNDFLVNLKNSIAEFGTWLRSDDGQAVIAFFVAVGEAIANLIVTVANVVAHVRNGWDQFRQITEGLRGALTAAFGGIGGAATAMFTVIGGGVNAFNWIGGVVGRIGGLVSTIQGAVRAINAALSAIRTSVVIDIITRRSDVKGYAKSIGGGGGGGGGGGLKHYAQGGRVTAGVPIIVGDGGRPEVFVPDSAGRILPRVPSGGDYTAWSGGGGGAMPVLSMPTNASNRLAREIARSLRVDIRRKGRGNTQRYLGSSGRL